MSQTIWIARHANRQDFVNPEWFLTAERRYDPPLSEDGFVQAQQLAQRLQGEKIHHIFASPFLRTVQTANAVAEMLDLSIKLETGLSEWLNPVWMAEEPKKLSISALKELYPRVDTSYTSRIAVNFPEEFEEEVQQRSGQTARCLADEFSPDNILLVGHGASVNGAAIGLAGSGIYNGARVRLCSLFQLVRKSSNQEYLNWELLLTGDTSHLGEVEEIVRLN
jgi:broad specificity phosphatase PhoE